MRRSLAFASALVCAAHCTELSAEGSATDINPQKGMMIIYTSRSTLVASGSGGMHGYNDLDQESWMQVQAAPPTWAPSSA